MSDNNSALSILSLNAQSINAKFDELKVIYLHNDYEYEPLPDIVKHITGWEQLFLTIIHKNLNSKKYIIGNVYRVPNEIVGNCNNFTDEFSNL